MGKPHYNSSNSPQQATSTMATNWTKWPSFAALARKRKFTKICQTIQEGDCEAVRQWLNATNTVAPPPDCARNPQPTPALHWLLEFQPPLATVERVIAALGRGVAPEDSVDAAGQTPLHVACAHRCESAVVARLAHGNGRCVTAYRSVDDRHWRTPLHCAVLAHWPMTASTGSGGSGGGGGGPSSGSSSAPLRRRRGASLDAAAAAARNNALESISTLVHAYPAAAHFRDRDGRTPLDCARERGADAALVRLLREPVHHSRNNHRHPYPSKPSNTNQAAALSGGAILFKNPAHHHHHHLDDDDDDHDRHHNPTETTEETEVTSIMAPSSVHNSRGWADDGDDDDMSSLGTRSFHQSAMVRQAAAAGRGPPKFERMLYEI